ncbi:MAG TPA: MotA/TolQ/ExbB proton channel family protein, partial [Verrucomicrobiae bacterium]|nr:MotA/TolQ/ExbB proton channel family protein [Verrucomicrobiae bacterium]
GRDGVREALEEAGLAEVPRLEEKLNLLATIAQISPILGLLGSVLGLINIFMALETYGRFSPVEQLAGGVWKALVCTAFGLAISIPAYAAYNYLVGRVNDIVLDMERASSEMLNLLGEKPKAA